MSLGLMIDVVVLLFLGVTIFYAWRLSTYMRIFRDSRQEMERLLVRLDSDIARAEKSVLGMRNAAENAAIKLNETIKESKFLADELKFMNEAGDNLASRLENLAARNRALVDALEERGGVTANTPYKDLLAHADREERGDGEIPQPRFSATGGVAPANQSGQTTTTLSSQAERDLYDALQRRGAQKQ